MLRLFFCLFVLFGKVCAMDFLPYCGYERVDREVRCYEAGIESDTLEDLRYVLHSLAYNSFSAILADRVQLQEALMRVDEVHPLHFISAVFSDSELTECLHLISQKSWLWRHFAQRVKRTLNEEAEADNMRPEYVTVFCDELDLEYTEVMECTVQRDWDWLILHLFEKFPLSEG